MSGPVRRVYRLVERVYACDDAYVLSGNGGCTGW
jgi:hypothetical protein